MCLFVSCSDLHPSRPQNGHALARDVCTRDVPVDVLALAVLPLLVSGTPDPLEVRRQTRDIAPCHKSPLVLRFIFLMCNNSVSLRVAVLASLSHANPCQDLSYAHHRLLDVPWLQTKDLQSLPHHRVYVLLDSTLLADPSSPTTLQDEDPVDPCFQSHRDLFPSYKSAKV